MKLDDNILDFNDEPVTAIMATDALNAIANVVENGAVQEAPAIETLRAIANVIIDYRNCAITYRRAMVDALNSPNFAKEVAPMLRCDAFTLCVKISQAEEVTFTDAEKELIKTSVGAHWILPIVIGRVYHAAEIDMEEPATPSNGDDTPPLKKVK